MSVAPLPSIAHSGERTSGCTDACRLIVFYQAGIFGRQSAVLHDAQSHEQYGADCVIAGSEDRIVRSGPLAIDLGALIVSVDDRSVLLSPTETRLMVALARRVGDVVRSNDLIESATGQQSIGWWGPNYVRTAVSRLRARLGVAGTRIVTHDGLGYRLLANGENQPPTRLRSKRLRGGGAP